MVVFPVQIHFLCGCVSVSEIKLLMSCSWTTVPDPWTIAIVMIL